MGSVSEPPEQNSLGQLLSNLRVCELGVSLLKGRQELEAREVLRYTKKLHLGLEL